MESKPVAPKPSDSRVQSSITQSLPFTKKISIGVEIGYTDLKLAKIAHLSEKKVELLDYANLPFQPASQLDSDDFVDFLRSALTDFCGPAGKAAIWSAISSAKVETRCIRIPRLPRKQIPNAVFWTFTKEVPFNKEEEVMDFQILEDIIEDGIQKTEVMTYTAPRSEINTLKDIFARSGFALHGISIVPFAIQNLLRTGLISANAKDICNLFIGRDWSRIAIYSGGNLILSRGIKAGMRSMIECIGDAIKNKGVKIETLPKDLHQSVPKGPLPDSSDPHQALAQKIFFKFLRSQDVGQNLSEPSADSKVFAVMLPALERLIRQIERTFEHYNQHFTNDGLGKILISGPVSANRTIIKHIGTQLGLPTEIMDPFSADSEFSEKVSIPESLTQRESFAPAIGMGLSSNTLTPNFLFTHSDRQRQETTERLNRAIFSLCMLVLLVLSATYLWQSHAIQQKENQVAALERQIDLYHPEADEKLILQLFSHAKQQDGKIKAISSRFAPLALIEEITQLTPSNIRLITFTTRNVHEKAKHLRVTLDGIIFGDRSNFETSLTSYMLRLKNSKLYVNPTISTKKFEFFDNQEVLRFTAQLDAA